MKQKEVIPAGTEWVETNVRHFEGSPSVRIGDEWMLITSGDVSSDRGGWNTMTASWGGMGVLWSTDVAFIFIRNTRRTFELANASELFSLSFFNGGRKDALTICGEKSGRDTDKAAAAGLTPIVFPDGTVGFKEALQVISCRKLYTHDIDPAKFLDPDIEKHYPKKDYHRMFIGKVTATRIRSGAN